MSAERTGCSTSGLGPVKLNKITSLFLGTSARRLTLIKATAALTLLLSSGLPSTLPGPILVATCKARSRLVRTCSSVFKMLTPRSSGDFTRVAVPSMALGSVTSWM